jgi:circadian clock protein KaiC
MRAVEFLYRSLTEFDRPGVFVTLEERPVEIMRNVKRLGWDIAPLVEQERLAFVDGSPSPTPATEVGPYDLEGLVIQIKHQVRSLNAQVVVIDSIGSLFSSSRTPKRSGWRSFASRRSPGISASLA